uniref:Sosondowah ankyrin repeat domain family member Ab n=1 Tax=Neolamprologus brichardi TaxID=32507 RepID=A0A3Q4MPY9_NEOBR
MDLTQESILSFLLEHGGKVKNSELLNYFRRSINCSDPAEKQHNRELFKKLVNSVAVVKQIDEVKFVVLRLPNKSTRQADDAKYSESVPLERLAHEWLVKCAAGMWGHIYALLLQDTGLAQRKDFMSGFTALHWAAKDGSSEMIRKLMDIPKKRGIHVNVNTKAHGGYTPLHIAAIHGHTEVMVLLVQRYRNVTKLFFRGKV